MTIRHLRIFAAVCEHKSITAAARSLYMTQPAVSLAIHELEESYGIALFDRLPRKLQITADGKRMQNYATHVVALFDEMEGAMKNPDAAGELRIGSSLTIGACLLPAYAQALAARCPGVKPRVFVDNSDNLVQGITAGRLDVGLVEGTVHDASIIATPFMDDALVAVCACDHVFARGESVDLDRFLAEPLLLRERGSGTRELFQSAVTMLDRPVVPAWESISTTALIRAVEAGCGVSVLPERLVAESLNAGRLQCVRLQGVELRRRFYMIRHKNKHISAAMRALEAIVFTE